MDSRDVIIMAAMGLLLLGGYIFFINESEIMAERVQKTEVALECYKELLNIDDEIKAALKRDKIKPFLANDTNLSSMMSHDSKCGIPRLSNFSNMTKKDLKKIQQELRRIFSDKKVTLGEMDSLKRVIKLTIAERVLSEQNTTTSDER